MQKFNKKRKSPFSKILLSFIIVILVGTLLLWLPWSTKSSAPNLSFIDALFMATSSVCVTGLSVVSNVGADFSVYGKIVLLILIEIGGLSFLTIACFFYLLLGEKIDISTRFMMKEALNQTSVQGIVKLVKSIIIIAFVIQILGAGVNLFVFIPYYKNLGVDNYILTSIGVSIFQSVSSFCNAGIDIIGTSQSIIPLKDNILFNLNTMILIILGGLGFVVIIEIFKKRSFKNFNLHAKIVVVTTLALLVSGAILVKLLNPELTILQAIFTSVTLRTAGFTSVDMDTLSNGSYPLLLAYMLVGASPCSTGGGIKTTTLFIIFANIFAFAKGKETTAFKREISKSSIMKAYVLVALSVCYVCFICMLVSIGNPTLSADKVTFECVSAFGTVGLSRGITTQLSLFSKIVICVTMYLGRLGPLTLTSLWNKNWNIDSSGNIRYVKEDVIVG